jgi:hypothetical protein
MKLNFVEHMDEVLMIALERPLDGLGQPVPPPDAVKTTRKEEKQNVTH